MLPSGIYGWDMVEGDPLTPENFQRVFEEAADIEVILVGTGKDIRPLPAALKTKFKEYGISSDPMSTGAAIRTYNIMLAEGRAVAAALTVL